MLFASLIAAIDRQTQVVDRRLGAIERLLRRAIGLPQPGPLSLTPLREEQGMLIFDVVLPALPVEPTDIVSGRLTYTIGAAEPVVVTMDKAQDRVTGLRGRDNDVVELSFVWIDDAGNRSVVPSVLTATLVDTFPPPDPGQMGIVVTGEEFG